MDVPSTAGWLSPTVSGSLDSTWLFTHAVPPAVYRVRFIPAHDPNRPHQHTCNHVCFFTHLLLTFTRLSLTAQQTSVRHSSKFTAPPCCDYTHCHAPNTHLLCNKEGLNHDTRRSQTPVNTAQKSSRICAFRASGRGSEFGTDCRFRNQRLRRLTCHRGANHQQKFIAFDPMKK